MKHKYSLLLWALFILAILTPSNAPSQTNFWELTNGPGASAISALAINSSGHIFVETGNGIFFRSIDNGWTWTQFYRTSIGPLAFNSSDHIFAGTFGGSFPNFVTTVLRSTDNGATWIETRLTNSPVSAFAFNRSGHVFAATDLSGVFRSTDNGDSWTQIGLVGAGISSLVTNLSGHIFAGTGNGIFRSTDNGGTWVPAKTGLTYKNVSKLVINSKGHLFAAVDTSFVLDLEPQRGGVFRSTDNGESWTFVMPPFTQPPYTIYSDVWALAINSNDQVFAAAYHEVVPSGPQGGVYRSTDDGDSWVNTGLTDPTVLALAINSSGRLFAGTSSGKIFRTVQSTTGVEKVTTEIPIGFRLEQNYPNPFNPSTTIQFSLLHSGYVTLKVFTFLGEEVASLLSENLQAGKYSTEWNANGMASGVYFYRLQAGAFLETKKLMLLK